MGDRINKRILPAALACVLAFSPAAAPAIGGLRHPSVEESVTGARGIPGPAYWPPAPNRAVVYPPGDSASAGPRSFMIRVSEESMYGIPGLSTSGFMAGLRAAGVFVTCEAAQLSSAVGSETRLALTAALLNRRWAVALGGVYDALALDGMAGTNMIGLNLGSLVWVTSDLRLGAAIERLRLSGEEYPGADVTLVLSGEPAPGVTLFGTVELDRREGAVPGAAVMIAGLGPFRLGFGYESGTDLLKGSMALNWRSFDFAVGVCYHEVLGEKREITLTWFG